MLAAAEGQVGLFLKLFAPSLGLLGQDAVLGADLGLPLGPAQQGECHASLEFRSEPAPLGHDCSLLCQDGTSE